MELNRSHLPPMGGFLLLSLLLHLLLLLLVPERRFLPEPAPEEPVVVEMRPPEARERELDLPPPEEERPRETPARRLGPADQVAEKETAPKGDAPEDRSPPPTALPRPQPAPPAVRPEPQPPKPQPKPEPEPAPQSRPAPEQTAPDVARPAPAPEPKPAPEEAPPRPRDLPDLSTLTRLPSATIARLEDQWRHKYRKDVDEGDAVWLDTERDILISFFRRFRNNIYGVWNYPSASADRQEEGTSLLKITVNRDGTVRDVKVMESSGHRELDREAVAAVWKGSPYGDLPKAYEGDELNVFAFFEYTLSRQIVY